MEIDDVPGAEHWPKNPGWWGWVPERTAVEVLGDAPATESEP